MYVANRGNPAPAVDRKILFAARADAALGIRQFRSEFSLVKSLTREDMRRQCS